MGKIKYVGKLKDLDELGAELDEMKEGDVLYTEGIENVYFEIVDTKSNKKVRK
jgi:hypothetical protein